MPMVRELDLMMMSKAAESLGLGGRGGVWTKRLMESSDYSHS